MAEALIAITIITVGLVGILSLLGQSLGITKVVGNEYIGANLAAEGIELMKNVIDNHIIAGTAFGTGIHTGDFEMDYNDATPATASNRLLLLDPSGFYNYTNGNPTIFRRTIRVNTNPNGAGALVPLVQIKVNSIVEWTAKGSPFKVDVEDRFFDWNPLPTSPIAP